MKKKKTTESSPSKRKLVLEARKVTGKPTNGNPKAKNRSEKKRKPHGKKKKLRVMVGSAIWNNLHIILPVTEICVHVWLEMHGHHSIPP